MKFILINRVAETFKTFLDDEDFEIFSNKKWNISRGPYGQHYVVGNMPRIKGKQKKRLLHRLILEKKIGRKLMEKEFVDHIDHNTLNNCRYNLRVATNAQNQANARSRKGSSSKYLGVSKNGRRWAAQIETKGQKIYLGTFNSEDEAANFYNRAAKKYHGEFANLNNCPPDIVAVALEALKYIASDVHEIQRKQKAQESLAKIQEMME